MRVTRFMKENTFARNTFLVLILTQLILSISSSVWAQTATDSVLIIRDKWGIPHIVAGNEQALFYGAGYAAAEDRLLQMVLARYSIQGRLAEVFGSAYLARDKKMRAVGYYRHASGSLPYLTESTRQILQAYANGVNSYMAKHPQHLAGLSQKYGGQPEKWTVDEDRWFPSACPCAFGLGPGCSGHSQHQGRDHQPRREEIAALAGLRECRPLDILRRIS